jgi:hypothetical protein
MSKTKPTTTGEKTCFYAGSYGHTTPYQKFTNKLWYFVCEKDMLWARAIYYPIAWAEQRYYDLVCLTGKHFDDYEGECKRCSKKLPIPSDL